MYDVLLYEDNYCMLNPMYITAPPYTIRQYTFPFTVFINIIVE